MLSILLSKARFRHNIAQRADSRRCQPEPVHPCINPDHFRQGPLDTIGGLLPLNQTRGDVSEERSPGVHLARISKLPRSG